MMPFGVLCDVMVDSLELIQSGPMLLSIQLRFGQRSFLVFRVVATFESHFLTNRHPTAERLCELLRQ